LFLDGGTRLAQARKKRNRKGCENMKRIGSWLSVLVLIGSLGVSTAQANDGVLLKQEDSPGSYCHEKFPAIRPSTLGTDRPTLKSRSTGDVIDFYGPCNESPTGKDQVWQQNVDKQLRFDRSYDD
jgi:hypothetical protein